LDRSSCEPQLRHLCQAAGRCLSWRLQIPSFGAPLLHTFRECTAKCIA
jgi:hypothetical protein